MQFPIVTNDLAQRIAQSEVDYMESWLRALQEKQDNPFAVEIKRFGSAIAFVTRSATESMLFNRVMGLGPEDEGLLDDILEFYHRHGVDCRIEVSPHRSSPDFLARLAKHGLYQFKFQTVLYGLPTADQPIPSVNVSVREVHADELDIFVDLYIRGFEEYAEVSQIGESTKLLHGLPGWYLYLACVDDTAGGTATLYMQDGIGSLAGAATIPAMRGKGCQTALLQRRIADAAKAGCDLVVGQTGVGTASQHNMERLGMRIAYTKAKWIEHR